jgi:hypothetical protein
MALPGSSVLDRSNHVLGGERSNGLLNIAKPRESVCTINEATSRKALRSSLERSTDVDE